MSAEESPSQLSQELIESGKVMLVVVAAALEEQPMNTLQRQKGREFVTTRTARVANSAITIN